jgi:hypothetical protein
MKNGRYVMWIKVIIGAIVLIQMSAPAFAQQVENTVAEFEQKIEDLKMQLAKAKEVSVAPIVEKKPTSPPNDDIKFGPFTIGGATRVNYIYGDYVKSGEGPDRGNNGGDVALDTIRLNVGFKSGDLIGKLEYRWYDGYNFLHTGWVGYELDEESQVQVGLTRVPFGPGPYGVSQSWFFDQHYYVGLSDDMDLGIKYLTKKGNWDLALAYFASSESNGRGNSSDSARYSYDAVSWQAALDQDGNVDFSAPDNGYEEENQFNLRAIYHLKGESMNSDIGFSLQRGELKGINNEDGDHWAISAHMINQIGNLKLATQLTRYKYDIGSDNQLGTDTLVPFGAYDFAWPIAADALIPAISASYYLETPNIPWLSSITPYIEYSKIVKKEDSFNDSDFVTLGAAWAYGGWYIYTDLVSSSGNYFVGNIGDDYSNIRNGVGDFGVNGNDKSNYRFNINFGYYF